MQITDYDNIHRMLKETVDTHGDKGAFRWFPKEGEEITVTWREFHIQARRVARSLIALGIEKGDKVNILSYTSYKWVLADLGITAAAGCTVGLYQSSLAGDCRYIIDHCEGVIVFAEDETQLEKLRSIRKEIPRVRKVVMFDDGWKGEGDDWIMGFDEFLALADDIPDGAVEDRINMLSSDDLASIVYTSGTTGVPKGAMLTHDNITFTAQSVHACGTFREDGETFLFLPLAHVFARTALYTTILTGNRTSFARGMDTLIDDFKLAAPHWFISVPRVFEKIHSRVIGGVRAKGGSAQKIFEWACEVGTRVSDCKVRRERVPLFLALKYALATKLVFSRINEALGGRVEWCISGAAPLDPTIARFFHAAGLLILEGIGMTEDTSFSHVNRFDSYDFGVVGPPGPGIEQKIAEDGELLLRGRNVMRGYYKMPEETTDTVDGDGWLRTGDMGEIGDGDVLRITGRKKELIITAGGKNIAPSYIEGVLSNSIYLNQVCVVGDKRKFLSAVVTLDRDNIERYAKENEIAYEAYEELLDNDAIAAFIDDEVAEMNRGFASFETIKKVTIVPDFTIENGLITPTFKLKKKRVVETYADRIDAMYLD